MLMLGMHMSKVGLNLHWSEVQFQAIDDQQKISLEQGIMMVILNL